VKPGSRIAGGAISRLGVDGGPKAAADLPPSLKLPQERPLVKDVQNVKREA